MRGSEAGATGNGNSRDHAVHMPTNDKPTSGPFLPPTGGQILHAIIDALRLRERDAQPLPFSERHLANFLHGDPLGDEDRVQDNYRRTIIAWIAETLIKTGMLPSWTLGEKSKARPEELLAEGLYHLVGFADGVRALLVPRSNQLTDPLISLQPLLNIAAVEFGLRLGGLFTMANLPKPMPAWPWAKPDGAGWFLRHWASRGVKAPMSQADLMRAAERASDGDSTVDRPAVSRWFHGKDRPSVQNTRLLAKAAATHYGQPFDQVHRSLECHDALHQIAGNIVAAIAAGGTEPLAWQALDNAAALALDVLRSTMEWIEQAPITTDERRALGFMIFARGTDQLVPWFSKLIPFIRDRVQDPTRRAYLLRSFGNLDDFLHQLVNSASDLDWHAEKLHQMSGWKSTELRDNLRRIVCGVRDTIVRGEMPPMPQFGAKPPSWLKDAGYEGAAAALAADDAHQRGDLERAASLWHEAAQASPNQQLYHFKLGATLGLLGRVGEAIPALRRAAEIQPSWEMPRREIAVLLLQHGDAAAAEAEVRQALQDLGRPDPALLTVLGGALSVQQRWDEACKCFDASLAQRPHDPETLHHAAQAHFFNGDLRRGLELAKRASDLGRTETLARYQAGEFGGTNRKSGGTPGEEV